MHRIVALVLSLLGLVFWLRVDSSTAAEDDPPPQPSITDYPSILISVLVRNKAHTLPYFLGHLEELDYPKDRLHLFIRTDHNVDSTASILDSWTKWAIGLYGSIDYHDDSASRRSTYDSEIGPFDWPEERYRRIIDLKEEALSMARVGWRRFDYVLFVDADNFLTYPRTLQRLLETKQSIVAPMLRSIGSLYSNFWAGVSERGYYMRTEDYEPIYQREMQGLLKVPMIHSTILINLNDPRTTLLTFDRDKLMTAPSAAGNGTDSNSPPDPLDDVLTFGKSARNAGLDLHLLNTFDFGYLLPPNDAHDILEMDIETMRHLVLEQLFHGPPGLLYSPFLSHDAVTEHLKPTTSEPGNHFDRIYLINLRRRPDRRNRMEWCLRILGFNASLVEAVDGKTLNDTYVYDELDIHLMPEYRDPYHNRTMTRGEIGCFLSHYYIWRDVIEHKYRRVLVLEDDLRFVKYFRPMLTTLMEEAEEMAPNWDLIYLGRKRMNPEGDGPLVSGCRYLSYVGYSYWTLSYALSYAGAGKLLDARPFENLVPVDEYLPIMFDKHPEAGWKSNFPTVKRNLQAFTAEPLLVFPTHYTNEPGYISDTENTPLAAVRSPFPPSQGIEPPAPSTKGDEGKTPSLHRASDEL